MMIIANEWPLLHLTGDSFLFVYREHFLVILDHSVLEYFCIIEDILDMRINIDLLGPRGHRIFPYTEI